jgi:hypothetical protein
LTASLLLALAMLAVPLAPVEATAAGSEAPIQPGDPLVDGTGDPYCTLSYVFDSRTSDEVYLSTAAHCVDQGDIVHTTGHDAFGKVVYDAGGDVTEDYALVRVSADERPDVRADVRGHPGTPTGVASPEDTAIGDRVTTSGWGTLTDETATTRENRPGVLVEHHPDLMRAQTAAHPGDSGGPWTHDSGLALGIVSQISIQLGIGTEEVETPAGSAAVPTPHAFAGDQGPTVESLLDGASQAGYELSLRTAS